MYAIQLFLKITFHSFFTEGMESLFRFFKTLSIMHGLGVTSIPMCKRKEAMGCMRVVRKVE